MANPLAYAARQPLAMTVAGCAILFGLLVSFWLLPIGLLAYAAMVFLLARDPNLQLISQQAPRQSRPRLSSPTFRTQIDAVERTQQEIRRSVAQAEGPIGRLLLPIGEQTRELVEEAYAISEKGQIIESYLARIDLNSIQQRIEAVDQQVGVTNDPYTMQQLQETRAALVEKQQNARDLMTYIGRIQAQLQNIAANLDNVLAETVRLRTADAVSANSMTNQVAQRLSDLKIDMDSFQRVLDTALATTQP
ncbi:MAG: hypothetical protein HC822_03330 [Oscillochloris sp.]|nr:hypothetical protein [Oscillochloris sp.]